jgi:hypothetical protein
MVWAISGLPSSGRMFLRGTPTEPPRAQMVQIVFKALVS